MDYLATRTSLSAIWRGFALGFVNLKKRCTRLAAASDKVYQLLAHGRWFSPSTPASSTTKTGRHDIAEILLKVALNTINQIKSKTDCINDVMINMHTSSVVDNGFKPRLGQAKDYNSFRANPPARSPRQVKLDSDK